MRGESWVVNALRQIDIIGISAISIGELYSGFKGGNREAENKVELGLFLDSPRVRVHPIDGDTAEFYASILNNLKKEGTPIPTNDIWIAAVAFQHGYSLMTAARHFSYIPGIILAKYAAP